MYLKKISGILLLLVLAACGNGHERLATEGQPDPTSVVSAKPLNGEPNSKKVSEETAGAALPAMKMIRTADFRCEVQNVLPVVSKLEQQVQSLGGIIQESRIENEASATKTIGYKQDSLKQVHTFTTTAWLTLRIPAPQLDSIIRAIPAMVSFIDTRTIRQNNVALQYMANELKNKADNENAAKDKALLLAKKTGDVLQAQEYGHNAADIKINRRIENLSLLNDVAYATLTVQLQQPAQVYTQIIADSERASQAPFLSSVQNALANGCDIMAVLFVSLLYIWPLLLLAAGAYIIYRRLKLKNMRVLQDHV